MSLLSYNSLFYYIVLPFKSTHRNLFILQPTSGCFMWLCAISYYFLHFSLCFTLLVWKLTSLTNVTITLLSNSYPLVNIVIKPSLLFSNSLKIKYETFYHAITVSITGPCHSENSLFSLHYSLLKPYPTPAWYSILGKTLVISLIASLLVAIDF